jgi:hypothetical protein
MMATAATTQAMANTAIHRSVDAFQEDRRSNIPTLEVKGDVYTYQLFYCLALLLRGNATDLAANFFMVFFRTIAAVSVSIVLIAPFRSLIS